MAHGGQQGDIQVLQDLQRKSLEVPKGVVQCLLQNNSSDACSKCLSQTSSDFLRGEASLNLSDKSGLSKLQNHMSRLHLGLRTQNVYVPPLRDGPRINGSKTLSHSLSDGAIQTKQLNSKLLQQQSSQPPPLQMPTDLSVFELMDATPSTQPSGLDQLGGKGHLVGPHQAPRFSPITVTLAPNVQTSRKMPTSLRIHGGPQPSKNSPSNSIYIRPYVTQSGTGQPLLQQASRSKCSWVSQQEEQQRVSYPFTSSCSWMLSSAHSTSHTLLPQSQGHQMLHVYMPVSSPINLQTPSLLQGPPVAQPASSASSTSSSSSSSSSQQCNVQNIFTGPRKNQIEIKLEQPQRNNSAAAILWSGSSPSCTVSSCPSTASIIGTTTSFHCITSTPLSAGGPGLSHSQPMVYISASTTAATPNEAVVTTASGSQPPFYISTNTSGGEASRCRNSPTVYISANPPLHGSPLGFRNIPAPVSMGPAYIHHHRPSSRASAGIGGGTVPSPHFVVSHPNTKYTFKITVSPNKPPAALPGVAPLALEHANLYSLPSNLCVEPEPHHLSDPLSTCREKPNEVRRLSVGSDDLAYSQALCLHQKARMERLVRKLEVQRHEVEKLKEEVHDLESNLVQRRLQRSSSTSNTPFMEEMQQLRCRNRMLQIDIDCLTKATDLLQTKELTFKSPKTIKGIEEDEGTEWSCTACTFLNHPALLHCEQCEFPQHF